MIIPSSYEMALLMGLLAFLCGAFWISTYKMCGNWRFELYYFDFAFGAFIATLVAGLTFGSMGTDLSFWDNLSLTAGRRLIVIAFFAGCVLNLANLLMVAGASIGGISLAMPTTFAVALIVESLWALVQQRSFNFVFLGIGWALLAVVIALCAAASKRISVLAEPEMVTIAEAVPSAQVGGPKYYRRRREEKKESGSDVAAWKAVLFAAIGGLLLGLVPGIGNMSRNPDIGLGPYSFAFVFTMGIFLSTFVFNLYFMNLPVQGQAVQFFRYFQGGFRVHVLGILGGILFGVGVLCASLMAAAPMTASPSNLVQYLLIHGAPMLAAGMGLLLWKELADAPPARGMAGIAAVLYIAAVALLGSAPRA